MERRIAVTAIELQAKSCELRNGSFLRIPQSAGMDIEWIREGLQKAGKSQKGLAEALGLDPAQVTRILKNGRRLRADELEKIREYLAAEEAPAARKLPFGADSVHLTRDVPVRGSASCGPDGVFDFNQGTIDWVRRPPRFRGLMDAYALYVAGDSMSPWREPGDLVYVNPHQTAKNGDYVAVQLQPPGPGVSPPGYIKKMKAKSGSELKLWQYNPPKEIIIPLKKVGAIHRIIDWTELMGV
jgi:phage repressor protein C with HTH and peptisase S24 domain